MSAILLANCYWCKGKVSLPSVQAFSRHVIKAHKGNDLKIFRCGQKNCFSTYSDLSTLVKHLRRHGVPDKKSLPKAIEKNPSDDIGNCNVHDQGNSSVQDDGLPFYDADQTVSDSSSTKDLNFCDFSEIVDSFAESFVAKQYKKPYLPRNYVQTVVNDITGLFSNGPLFTLKDHVLRLLTSNSVKSEDVLEVEKMFERLGNPFDKLQTEHRRIKRFMESEQFIPPESYVLGKRLKNSVNSEGVSTAIYSDVCAQFIPTSRILKSFLEMGDTLSIIENYMKSLESTPDCISNIVQSRLWKSKVAEIEKSSTDLVLPLLVYSDDFEPNNPLGPHSEKLGAVYCSLPCLPSPCLAKLENIFLTLLFDSADRREFGNAKTFYPLVEELTSLEKDGITVFTQHGLRRVFFLVVLVIGDNLAIHTMLGLVESFSAGFFCRFCRIEKRLSTTLTVEDVTLLRNIENYQSDLATGNFSLTGIKEDCVFNAIPSFHLCTNYSVDALHDLIEGVCHSTMIFILSRFLREKLFSLETLNFRLDMFTYGPIDNANKPPLLSEDALTKSKLKMTGREMMCFVYMFGVIIGDLIPLDHECWLLYKLLRQILNIVMAKSVCEDDEASLRAFITKYLELFLQLDDGNYLKPKHHFLTHYPRVLNQVGPLSQIACWRFEAKHKELKATATSTTCRINLPKTIAVKQQLGFFARVRSNLPLLPETEFGPAHIVNLTEDDMYPFFRNALPDLLKEDPQSCLTVNWVEHNGTRYASNMALVVGVEDHMPRFAQIKLIITLENPQDDFVFLCQKLHNRSFDEHVIGYEVLLGHSWECVHVSNLLDPLPVFVTQTVDRGKRIILRYRL